jgi:hypothetical protein
MDANALTPKFEDALEVMPLDDGTNWRVLQAFHYDTNVPLAGIPSIRLGRVYHDAQHYDDVVTTRIEVPAGFVTDFASIPRPFWGIVGGPADGRYRKIAVVHDLLYRTAGLCTRPQADAVLLEGMKVSGCGWYQRYRIWLAVRIGGGASYKGGL